MTPLLDLSRLSQDEQDAPIQALRGRVEILTTRATGLAGRLAAPVTSPDNSSRPSSEAMKPNQAVMERWRGSRKGSLGRKWGGRMLAENSGRSGCPLIEAALDNVQDSTK